MLCRPRTISSVWLSNVTLWVPAAEFSYIRSYAIDTAVSNFSIELNGAQPMRFTNVRDMKAEGVFVEHYRCDACQGSEEGFAAG